MCYQNLPSHPIVECLMGFIPLFCELGDKSAHLCRRHFFTPSRRLEAPTSGFAVNELRFLG
jgi:hypothetical protein